MNVVRRIIGTILLVVLFLLPWYSPFQIYLSIPSQITTFHNQDAFSLPAMGNYVNVHHENDAGEAQYAAEFTNIPVHQSGQQELTYTVSNIPVKKVNVDVYDDYKLIPGGHSIGINLQTEGVLVVGYHLVQTDNGEVSPGEDAGIKIGDSILSINGNKITKMDDVTPIVKEAGENGQSLDVEVKRGKDKFKTELTPILNNEDKNFQIGLFIRDSAAGIGTMTFIDPQTKKYGALGHVISDMDTQKPVDIYDGTIVRSKIKEIQKGSNGIPGEKRADFVNESELGNITKNSPFGIFGEVDQTDKFTRFSEPLSIAFPHEVEEGNAKILTVIDGEKIEAFDVKVVNSVDQSSPATKGLIIEITDKRLLEATGGIIQGMSGSPIIQNNKIIGAVTHVFVNDPTSGYGVHIEWMLKEAGIDIYKQENKKAS